MTSTQQGSLPSLTVEERRHALERAAEVRHQRALLRKDLKTGRVKAEEVLNSDDPIASRMRVELFLCSLPGIGKRKAQRIMDEAEVAPNRRVGGLGGRQRERILEIVTG